MMVHDDSLLSTPASACFSLSFALHSAVSLHHVLSYTSLCLSLSLSLSVSLCVHPVALSMATPCLPV